MYNVVGRSIFDVIPGVEDAWLDRYKRVAKTGEPLRVEDFQQDVNRWFEVYLARVDDAGRFVTIVFNDVTERKLTEQALRQSEERQTFLLKLSDAFRPLADPVAIQSEAARVLGQHLDAGRAAYAEIDADDAHFTVHRDYTDGVPSYAGHYPLEGNGGPEMWADLRAGRTILMADAERDTRLGDADLAAYAAGQVRAAVAVPLVKGGRLSVVFFLHFATPHEWTAEQVAFWSRRPPNVPGRRWSAPVPKRRCAGARNASANLSMPPPTSSGSATPTPSRWSSPAPPLSRFWA